MERRVSALEQRFGPTPDPGRLVIIAPNSWADQDRDAWERAEILHDADAKDELIEKYTGIRPTRRIGVINVVVVPAPQAIEEADEATRAAWRARRV
jgi:hypothetical protein